jgi:D-alanyl-D-alanine carboxypeptidase
MGVEEQLQAVVSTGVPGAAVVAFGPAGRVEEAVGLAEVQEREPLTPHHRFRIGSVTKIFVAPLVLRLVDEGVLDLDGDAGPFAQGITIRQLLNHTSGLPDSDLVSDIVGFCEPYRHDPAHRVELSSRALLALALEKPRLFPPGEGWAYRGVNYLILGLIVEEKTGLSLREALRQRLLAPLGLDRTDLVPEPLRGDCARGYLPPDNPILPGNSGWVDVTEIEFPFYGAGGGMVSTPGEVAKMLRVLLGGDLLSSRLRNDMLQAVDSDWPETDRYGLGIGEITALMGGPRSPCGSAWGHIGFSLGYTTFALSSADGERQVVVCANGASGSEEEEVAFFDAAGRLAWDLYCM